MEYSTLVRAATVRPDLTGNPTAAGGHAHFAIWLVQTLKPKIIVELGSSDGSVYFNFCRAVQSARLRTKCYAVDRWDADVRHGLYEEEGFTALHRHNERHFGGISSLLRMTPDAALDYFADTSIDLLHLAAYHDYNTVRHAFETWLPKLTPTAIVLFHGTNVRERGCGVWRLWEEVARRYPLSLEFAHSHGLGVLQLNEGEGDFNLEWLAARSPDRPVLVEYFGARGIEMEQLAAVRRALSLHHQALAERDREVATLRHAVTECEGKLGPLCLAATERDAMFASVSWRITRPLRVVLGALRGEAAYRAHLRAAWARLHHRSTRGRSVVVGPPLSAPPAVSADLRVVYVSGEALTPGHHYRVARYAESAGAAGAQVVVMRIEDCGTRMIELAAAQVVVIWRAAWSEQVAAVLATARKFAVRIIYDVDDLIIDPALARSDIVDGIRSEGKAQAAVQEYFSRQRQTMMQADLCTVTTQELAVHVRRACLPVLVLPNGFDEATLATSALAVRQRAAKPGDGLLRIGYAGGSVTHQHDFALCAFAVGEALRSHAQARLVLFWDADRRPLLNINEFPDLAGLANQIEWRDRVPLDRLPEEIARFDVNLAPLEVGNPFCEAKSELKFFEAALVGVCTIASPTGPFRRAIRNGETGCLASTAQEWHAALSRLLDDPTLRMRMAKAAALDVLWTFGPERRAERVASILDYARGGRAAAHALVRNRGEERRPATYPAVPEYETVFARDRLGQGEVTVVIPLHHDAESVESHLDSVTRQTLGSIDLVIVDDASTDDSLGLAHRWAARNADRFNRLLVLRNRAPTGRGSTRNVGFAASETLYVLALDAHHRLLPNCLTQCLEAIRAARAAYAYPQLRQLGAPHAMAERLSFDPLRCDEGENGDAIALVSKAAWMVVGGYHNVRYGKEDDQFLCRIAELGLMGVTVGREPLADYRLPATTIPSTTSTPGPDANLDQYGPAVANSAPPASSTPSEVTRNPHHE